MTDVTRYKSPPIAEAVIEVRFEAGDEWSIEVVSNLRDHFRPNYPALPKQIVGSALEITSTEADGSAALRVATADILYEFASEDGRRLVRVGGAVLTVHILAPYTSWDEFGRQVSEALDPYISLAKPKAINRLGVRYINKIELGPGPVELGDYCTIAVDVPEEQGFRLGSFFVRTEARFHDGPIRMIRTFASAPSEQVVLALDIDVIDERRQHLIPTPELMDQIDTLRSIEREVFESSITERLRRTFGVKD